MIVSKEYKYDIREFQMRSLVLLETIDKVCKEHGINYYIIDGTLLGARRHGGYIPWDDDMDIALMRKDYDLLVEHADEWLPESFFVVTHENTPLYPKYFAKLEDTSTTIVENFHLNYMGGIYIDLFPLDYVPDDKLLRSVHYYKFNLLRRLQYLLFRNPYKHGKGLSSVFPLLIQRLFTRKWVHRKMQDTLREYNGKPNCNYVMTHDDFRAYPKECLGTPSTLTFEGIEASAPADVHTFLSIMYGDNYMTPPPVEERRSHFHAYVDFGTPYKDNSIEQIKQQCE